MHARARAHTHKLTHQHTHTHTSTQAHTHTRTRELTVTEDKQNGRHTAHSCNTSTSAATDQADYKDPQENARTTTRERRGGGATICWGAEEVVEEEMAVAVSRVAFFAPTEQLPLERATREQASERERERERESESESERERERDELEGSLALDGARYNNHTSTRERRHASSNSYYGSILRLY